MNTLQEPLTTLQQIEAAAALLSTEDLKALETHVHRLQEQHEERRLMELERRVGFRSFPKRSNQVITTKMVLKLCEEEGI